MPKPVREADLEILRLLEEVRKRRKKFQKLVLQWAMANLRSFPWREERTPYRILVAEVILRRTTSTAASRIYKKFLEKWPNIRSLSRAEIEELERVLEAVGYHKRRARILVDMARYIEKNYGGVIPADMASLLRVPHVGPYIAGAILSLGYGVPAAMVDSNVQRILSRCFHNYLPERGQTKTIQTVTEALVPNKEHVLFNLGLLDLGALICRYDRPRCDECPLRPVCDLGGMSHG